MKWKLCALALLTSAAVFSLPINGFAQGGTTSTLAGVVLDSAGGVVPGADVTIKHAATGSTQNTVSNSDGGFSFPSINVGTYTVTVKLQGFKTFIANDVVLTSGAGANVRAVLEVGGLEEQIIVSSSSEIVQTQSSTISTTMNTNQITKLPLTSRSAMDFVTFFTGVSTPGGNRDSTISGLPQSAINITLDGVNIQDNTLKTGDGFFAIVSPRLDSVEEVTVTTAAQGADSSGQGAVNIKFVTRSGTNSFSGSGYHYYRSDRLNANTWFNNRDGVAKPELLQNQAGVRVGGPIVIPGLFDGRNKAFFFVNYEEFRQPSDTTRNRNLLNTDAQQGIYRYGSTSVNLLQLAAANGQTSTFDPTIRQLLQDIRTSTNGGSLSDLDLNVQRFSYNVPVESIRRYPTFRIDYNITDSNRFSTAYNYQYFTDFPDTLNNRDAQWPGFPVQAGQKSERISWSNSLRSTISANIVNEVRVGYSGAPVTFSTGINKDMYSGSLANQSGFHLTLPAVVTTLTNASTAPAPQARDASSILIEDTFTWLKGTHSLSLGGSITQYSLWMDNSSLLSTLQFGIVNGDPAQGMFNAANFPGASQTVLTGAQNLYALLTGRVTSIAGDARINEDTGQYESFGVGTQRARMRESGLFIQDSWRWKPNFTVNLGLRYELQFPFYPLNDSFSTATLADLCGISGVNPDTTCNLFQAGVTPGKRPEFINFGKGEAGYNTDYNNFAPSVGLAWTLKGQEGALGKVFGSSEADTVFRAGYTRSFNRNGMNDFSGQYNANPGIVISTTRSANLGNLGALPVLFRDTGRLGPAPFPLTPVYPMTDVISQDINLFDPDIQVPYADSWTAGIQRTLGRNMALEVRYVGTRSKDLWQSLNYNEINVFDNGFINEFRAAQANLRSHVAAGCGGTGNACSFRYRGPGTGTTPLPVMFGFFQGAGDPNNSASYTSGSFQNNTFLTSLATFDPNPFDFAEDLYNNAGQRTNAAAARIPENFFLANPDLQGGADLTTNSGRTKYNSLQVELRRRLSQGLQFQTSYVFGKAVTDVFETFRRPTFYVRDTGAEGDLTHAFKANVVYDLPFGQGRRFGGNAGPVLDRVIGGWTLGLTSRIQSGRLIDLGNVRVVGMSLDEVQDIFNLRFDSAAKEIYMFPRDVIDQTIKAFSVSATSASGYGSDGPPTGRYFAPANGPDCIEVDNGADYGECGTRSLVVTGPMFQQHDLSIAKRINLVGRTNFEFRFEMLNVFNKANFAPVGGIGDELADFEVTGLTGTNTARVIQLVSRFNW